MRGDPVEKIVADALDKRGIRYEREGDGRGHRLDFYIPDADVYIEVCAYYTPRKVLQMEFAPNVILIQGRDAAKQFSHLLCA